MVKYPQALVWVDIQTANLAEGNDFSGVYPLDIAVIVTDLSLEKLTGWQDQVKLTKGSAQAALSNEYVKEMHTKNGLLQECKKSTVTVDDIDEAISEAIREGTAFEKGEFLLAGSEVGTFELPLIREKFPKLSSWLAHYTFDTGNASRVTRILNGGQPIVNITGSKTKTYRAIDQVNADILEAETYQDSFRRLGL